MTRQVRTDIGLTKTYIPRRIRKTSVRLSIQWKWKERNYKKNERANQYILDLLQHLKFFNIISWVMRAYHWLVHLMSHLYFPLPVVSAREKVVWWHSTSQFLFPMHDHPSFYYIPFPDNWNQEMVLSCKQCILKSVFSSIIYYSLQLGHFSKYGVLRTWKYSKQQRSSAATQA